MYKCYLFIILTFLTGLPIYGDPQEGAAEAANDRLLRREILGIWSDDWSHEQDGVPIIEKVLVNFSEDGTYLAIGTENVSKNRQYHMRWRGTWQINASVLSTPTTETSGFEEDLHPHMLMMKCKIVSIDEDQLVYHLTLGIQYDSTNKLFGKIMYHLKRYKSDAKPGGL